MRKAIEPNLEIIRNYRNNVAFHANMKLREYVLAIKDFRERRSDVVPAIQRFLELAEKLMKEQGRIPDCESRLDRTLKKKFPEKSPEELQRLKEYFIVA